MSRNIAILLTFCLTCFSAESRTQNNAKTVLRHNLRASVVSVVSYGVDGSILARGVGFFVSERGDVLTRLSLIPPEAARTEIKTLDSVVYQVRSVIGEDTKADLVKVGLENFPANVKPIPSATFNPQFGDRVYVIDSETKDLAEGIVTAVEASGNNFQVAASLHPQSSGSPVINVKGEVVGMVISTTEGGHSFTAAQISSGVFLYPRGARFQPSGPITEDSPAGAVRRGENLFQGTAVTRVAPAYPPVAKRERVDGTIIVQVLVDETGNVVSVRPMVIKLKHHAGNVDEVPTAAEEALKQAAVEAVSQWKFAPTKVKGKPVKVIGTVTLNFHL